MNYDDPYKLFDQMLKAVDAISDKTKFIIQGMKEATSSTLKGMKNVSKEQDKQIKKAKTLATIASDTYKNFKLREITNFLDKTSATLVKDAKIIQQQTGATLSTYSKFYKELASSAREINSQLGKNTFSTTDLLQAANKLAEIGWSDLKTLKEVAPALAKVEKSLGQLSTGFHSSVIELQKTFKSGTSDLVEALGSTLTAYSELFGVTTATLEKAITVANANLIAMSGGSTAHYEELKDQMASAVALASQVGGQDTADAMTMIISSALNDSIDEFSTKYATAFGTAGISATAWQQQIQSGDMLGAMTELLSSMGTKMQGAGALTGTYKNLYAGFGLSDTSMQAISNNVGDISSYLEQLGAVNLASMQERLENSVLSVSDQISNFVGSSTLVASLSSAMSAVGLDSLDSVLLAILSCVQFLESDAAKNQAKKAFESLSGGKGGVAGIFSAGWKLAAVAVALAAAMKIIQKVLEKDSVKKAVKTFTEVLDKLSATLEPIIDLLADVVANLIERLASKLDTLVQKLEPVIASITTLLERVLPIIADLLIQVMDALEVTIIPVMELVTVVLQVICSALSELVEVLTPVIEIIAQVLEMVTPLLKVIKSISDVLNAVPLKLLEAIFRWIQVAFDKLQPVIDGAVYWMEQFASGISWVAGKIKDSIGWLFDWLSNIDIWGWKPFEGLKQGGSTQSAGGMVYGYGMTSEGFHVGQDIPMASGTPIAASSAGLITGTGYNDVYGNWVSMMADGVQSVFGHLDSSDVSAGDVVMPGQTFATSGNTGDSLVPHVHYETRQNGQFVDPIVVSKGNNADVVKAIKEMTVRLENKLDEVSKETEFNSNWIKEFDEKNKGKVVTGL